MKPFGGNPPKFAGMDKPTFTAEQFDEAVKAADSLRYWLQRIAEEVARRLEEQAAELRQWK